MLREIFSNDIFTILLLIGLSCVVLSKFLFAVRFSDFIGLLTNSKYLNIYTRDQKFIDGFESLLFINLVLGISITSFLCYKCLHPEALFEWVLISKIIFGIAAIFIVKVMIERLLSSIFEIDEIIERYIFQKSSYKNFGGLLLIPINALLLYSIHPTTESILYLLVPVLIINLLGFIRILRSNQNLIISHFFYFILYLCALEIAPYILLYKYISNN
ncbi:MAG: DUF4271 domain-containing protein [Bacteroidetes bacterium MedPE-SWsnd-G2]|nr:MAG: DUF4271 domain-containing protein [Bacteroidetes bacterium MedPE-SWsnd-G2]